MSAKRPVIVPTDRDLFLLEIACENAAESCQAGATLRGSRVTDPLAAEYLHAARSVAYIRKALGIYEATQ